MAAVRRSKTNGKFFQDIPKPAIPPTEEIINLLRKKYAMKEQRTALIGRMRELRTQLYNVSKNVNELELKIDKILVEKLKEDGHN